MVQAVLALTETKYHCQYCRNGAARGAGEQECGMNSSDDRQTQKDVDPELFVVARLVGEVP